MSHVLVGLGCEIRRRLIAEHAVRLGSVVNDLDQLEYQTSGMFLRAHERFKHSNRHMSSDLTGFAPVLLHH